MASVPLEYELNMLADVLEFCLLLDVVEMGDVTSVVNEDTVVGDAGQ